jgi:hypothetical protein
MAVDVPADAAHRLPRPRGPQLAVSYALYNAKQGRPPLSQRMLDATGAKRFYPPSLRHHPDIKTEGTHHKQDIDAASNV